MLGLQRLGLDAIWLELLPATSDPGRNQSSVRNFQQQLNEYGLSDRYCLLLQHPANDVHDFDRMECIGLTRVKLLERLAGPNVLLNLSYSLHPPFLSQFERRIFCDLDPSEIFYWMTKMEMGQSFHHEFWTIGLNAGVDSCRLPPSPLPWKTFFPLVDTLLLKPKPAPPVPKFTTVGQWYWGGGVEVDGQFPDLSKKFAFEQYLDLPRRFPHALFELAMNFNPDDPEIGRLEKRGWRVVSPHEVTPTPGAYYQYLTGAQAEFTAIKGVDVAWKTGWLSDRAAAFCALGRPVITEDTGAASHLPSNSGLIFVNGIDDAERGVRSVLSDWPTLSRQARSTAEEVFDAARNLRRILNF